MPTYYLIDEDAARRAKKNNFSDYKLGSATESYCREVGLPPLPRRRKPAWTLVVAKFAMLRLRLAAKTVPAPLPSYHC